MNQAPQKTLLRVFALSLIISFSCANIISTQAKAAKRKEAKPQRIEKEKRKSDIQKQLKINQAHQERIKRRLTLETKDMQKLGETFMSSPLQLAAINGLLVRAGKAPQNSGEFMLIKSYLNFRLKTEGNLESLTPQTLLERVESWDNVALTNHAKLLDLATDLSKNSKSAKASFQKALEKMEAFKEYEKRCKK